MEYSFKTLRICTPSSSLMLAGCTSAEETYYAEADFDKVEKADVHIHIFTESNDFIDQAVKDNFKVVSIALDAEIK